MAEFEGIPDTEIDPDTVTPETLRERIDKESTTLLDVRSASDYESWKIEGEFAESINIPYYEFLDDEIESEILDRLPGETELVVYCAKGGSSEFVAGKLLEHGFDALHLDGGMNRWAELYDAVEITSYTGSGTVIQYQRPSSGCLAYFIHHEGEAAIIDPLRAFTNRYIADAAELGVELQYALDTHIHADHLSGTRQLSDHGIEAIVPAAAEARGITYLDAVTAAEDSDVFTVGEVSIETLATPGHTTEMTSYLIDDVLLVTGDGLFIETVARPDLEAGDEGAPAAARTLYESLQDRILSLPGTTLIGGAHYSDAAAERPDESYTAHLSDLMEQIDILTADKDDFVESVLADMPPRPANYEEIIATNLGKQTKDEDEAFRIELGPNNCAASNSSLAEE